MNKDQVQFVVSEIRKMTALMEQEGALLSEQIRIRKEMEKTRKEWNHVRTMAGTDL